MDARSKPMTKWEYRTAAERGHGSFEKALNALGGEGWEVISIETANGHHQAWLKRAAEPAQQKAEPQPPKPTIPPVAQTPPPVVKPPATFTPSGTGRMQRGDDY